MSIEKKLRESFSEITPPTDNGTIVRNVIERAENMNKNESRKPRSRRVLVTVIAAAAVLAAATVSVGAATGWSFNSAFSQANQAVASRYDGNHNPKPYSSAEEQAQTAGSAEQPASVDQSKLFDYLSGGKELDLWYDLENFKLNIKGICADNMTAYVLFDIIFDEDFDYSPKEGWTEWETCAIVDAVDESLDEQPELGMVCLMSEGVISQDGNVLHCYVTPSMSNKYTWAGKTMTLDFMNVGRYVPSLSEKQDASYSDNESPDFESLDFGENGLHVEIPIDFPTFEAVTWEIDQPIDLAAGGWNRSYGERLPGTVKYFSATPLGYSVYIETDTSGFTKGDCYTFDISFSVGGNAVSKVPGNGYLWTDDNGQGEYGLFPQPIDPADITSITICGQTFELN